MAPRLSLRLVQWNIRDGCAAEPSRLAGIGRWLWRARADAATFNELNGWSPAQFGRLAASWGLPHAALLETTTGYHVGLASRHPIAVEEANVSAPFHHGLLVVQLAGVRIALTHLSPADAIARRAEATALLEVERRQPSRPLVVVGDLNTLSPLDAAEHDAQHLPRRLAADEALARKFLVALPPAAAAAAAVAAAADAGAVDADAGGGWLGGGWLGSAAAGEPPPAETAAVERAIDYAPMATLLDGGFHDAGHASSVRAAAEAVADGARAAAAEVAEAAAEAEGEAEADAAAELHNHSVPTRANADFMHAAAMRLDYALLNGVLAARCAAHARLVRDEETDRLSDHYPLVVDLSCADSEG